MATALLHRLGEGWYVYAFSMRHCEPSLLRSSQYERKDAVRRLFEYQANSCRGLSESAEVRSLSEFPEEEEV